MLKAIGRAYNFKKYLITKITIDPKKMEKDYVFVDDKNSLIPKQKKSRSTILNPSNPPMFAM